MLILRPEGALGAAGPPQPPAAPEVEQPAPLQVTQAEFDATTACSWPCLPWLAFHWPSRSSFNRSRAPLKTQF